MSELFKRSTAKRSLAAALLCLCAARSAAAQTATGALTSQRAVEIAIKNNPSLHIALLQETQARYSVTAEDALYDPVFGADASYGHNRNPSVNGATGTIVTTTDTLALDARLTKSFATGTSVTAQLSGQRQARSSLAANTLGGTNAFGPFYSVAGSVALTQPLLRGAGSTLGLASLRVAQLNRTAATLAAQQTGSQVLHDVLVDYWELWFATESVRIDEASRDLAKTQQTQAEEQVKSGTLANVDALPFATQTAQQDVVLDTAVTNVRQNALGLALVIGQVDNTGAELTATDTPPDVTVDELDARAIDEALTASYELKQAQANLQVSQYQAKIAGDSLRPRLDLSASVTAQGLGNRAVSPAFDQFGRLDAVSAQVALAFETPVTNTRRNAQIESALLSMHIAEKQIESQRQQIKTNIESTLSKRNAAKRRLEFALVTEKVSHDQALGVQGKFQAGTALAIEVQKANNDYQSAQLTVQRARVDLVEAELDLLNLRGKLLERYAELLKSYQPTALILKGATDPM
ncbi:MAG TPA: TolC family protein [Polyangiaceae bacterium]